MGTAKRVVDDKDNTTIVDGAGKGGRQGRVRSRFVQIEDSTSDYDREKRGARPKLVGGVASGAWAPPLK